jgi:hypothetical protein
MSVVVESILGAPLIGVVLLLGGIAYVASQSARHRRKRQLIRERQRRDFWGFE